MTGTSVVVAVGDPQCRESLRKALADQPDMLVEAIAENGLQALEYIYSHKPDVMVCDLTLSDVDGVSLTRRLREIANGTSVLILATTTSPEWIRTAVKAGVRGFVDRTSAIDEVVDAVRLAAEGFSYTSAALRQLIAKEEEPAVTLAPDQSSTFSATTIDPSKSAELERMMVSERICIGDVA